MALNSMMMVRALGLLPVLAITATVLPVQPMLAFEGPSTPDENGVYSFNAEAGEVISIHRQYNSGTSELCYPDLISGEEVTFLGDSLKLTPNRESLLVKINTSGTYQYVISTHNPVISLGEDEELAPLQNFEQDSASVATAPAENLNCQITVQLASDYEQTWVEANRLYYEERNLEEALPLYRQVIEAEPGYPEPYKQHASILLDLYTVPSSAEIANDPIAVGQMLMTLPDAAKQSIIADLEQLAQIYETSPAWQVAAIDQPDFLRDFATYIQTGVASELIKDLMFSGS